ncbi:ribonucleases P/MRP protein subunit Pop3p [[Candida] jaroonii]|uniref:Ribonucleases P/MRP protein subunit Pop3p n=1 Tax=[Candida] jaroonii TaxID=467808 RepID=A0ACA9Y237_9ASCO|nr:ribonucleases P/MRP protein subunit Pop3p [[Candida] jaroonii]
MSDKTNTANSLKEREKRKRQVLKPILDNPFTTVNWPFVEPQKAEIILEHLCLILNQISTYKNNVKNSTKPPPPPEVMNKTILGFNEITSALEKQAKSEHDTTINYVLVCKYDLQPSILTQHFPVLTYTASKGSNTSIKLVQLPRGSLEKISDAVGENVGIIGLMNGIPHSEALMEVLNSIDDVNVPYLETEEFQKLQIKFISTSMPIGVPKNDQKQKKKVEKVIKK